jgi:hypothetical protein
MDPALVFAKSKTFELMTIRVTHTTGVPHVWPVTDIPSKPAVRVCNGPRGLFYK